MKAAATNEYQMLLAEIYLRARTISLDFAGTSCDLHETTSAEFSRQSFSDVSRKEKSQRGQMMGN